MLKMRLFRHRLIFCSSIRFLQEVTNGRLKFISIDLFQILTWPLKKQKSFKNWKLEFTSSTQVFHSTKSTSKMSLAQQALLKHSFTLPIFKPSLFLFQTFQLTFMEDPSLRTRPSNFTSQTFFTTLQDLLEDS